MKEKIGMEAMRDQESLRAKATVLRVLITDDSPTARGILRRALESSFSDCEVYEAADGRSAMREMTKGKMDLIITDLEMPGVDGHRFLQTMQGNPLLKKKKILVFSSAISLELKNSMAGQANIGFLSKPATPKAIAEAVRALLGTPHS